MPKKAKDTKGLSEEKRKKREENRKYYQANKERLNAKHLERYHTKYKHDPEYKEKQSIIAKDHYNTHKEEMIIKSAVRKRRIKQEKIAREASIIKPRPAKKLKQKTIKTDTPTKTIPPRKAINTNIPKKTKVLPASDIEDLFENLHSGDITGFAKCDPILNQMQIDAPFSWQENENPVYNNPLLSSQLMFGSKPKTPSLVEQCLEIEDNDTFNDFIQTQLELN